MSGDVVWRPDDVIMVIDGYGYTHSQWVNGTAPRYDVDAQGRWFNLEDGREVPSQQQPEGLPARYGVWHDGTAVRAMVAEAGQLIELPVQSTVADALVSDMIADVPDIAGTRERLEEACAITSRQMTEFTVDDVEAMLRGDLLELTPYTWSGVLGPEAPMPFDFEAQVVGEAVAEPVADLSDGIWDL